MGIRVIPIAILARQSCAGLAPRLPSKNRETDVPPHALFQGEVDPGNLALGIDGGNGRESLRLRREHQLPAV